MTEPTFHEQQKKYWNDQVQKERRDPRHPTIEAYVTPKIAEIKKHMNLPSSPTILDVGAGNGYFSYYWNLLGETTAIDYAQTILEGNPVKTKLVMDARAMTFADNTFDLSFCHAVLHHVDLADRMQVIKEMARVSKHYVAYIEPNILNPIIAAFSTLKKEEHGALKFTPRYVRSMAEDAGLKIVWSSPWGLLTPNRMPFANLLMPFFQLFERKFPLGVTTIVIAEKH